MIPISFHFIVVACQVLIVVLLIGVTVLEAAPSNKRAKVYIFILFLASGPFGILFNILFTTTQWKPKAIRDKEAAEAAAKAAEASKKPEEPKVTESSSDVPVEEKPIVKAVASDQCAHVPVSVDAKVSAPVVVEEPAKEAAADAAKEEPKAVVAEEVKADAVVVADKVVEVAAEPIVVVDKVEEPAATEVEKAEIPTTAEVAKVEEPVAAVAAESAADKVAVDDPVDKLEVIPVDATAAIEPVIEA